tara:strand:+ start:414 stop:962 length:549 start_codon:yes stop_codon:yes gene_type:complete
MYPTTISESFFNDPDSIVKLSKKIKFFKPKTNENWPGLRSKPLHSIDIDLHNFIMNKIISIYYDCKLQQVFWESSSIQFHKIKPSDIKKWGKKKTHIHKDLNFELAGVIYLNRNVVCESTGTSIYNDNIKKLITVSNNYNSLLMYDANKFHGVTKFTGLGILRIVIFIKNIKTRNNFLERLN